MEDGIIDGELAGINSGSSKRKAEEMLGTKDGDGDIHESKADNGLKPEDETSGEKENFLEGGGVIKDLISTLFRPGNEQGRENVKADGENKAESGSSETASDEDSGGIIRSIVSHLPPSLPEDAAPTTDEASILIHSIIHD